MASVQDNNKHVELMQKYPDMEHDDPNAKSVDPGKTAEILRRFTKAGTFEFAYLIPGYRKAGMRGTGNVFEMRYPVFPLRMVFGPSATEGAPSPECTIKGNISRNGERIYHMENQSSYARIKLDKGDGRRWFCTPEEAETAGWRRALR